VAARAEVQRVVVVGGGIGGARTVGQLRRRGYEGEIVLFGAESRLPYDPVPYFWSDQFGHKIQYVGAHAAGDRPIERAAGAAPGRTVSWIDDAGRVTAVLTVDRPRESAAAGALVAQRRFVPLAELKDPAASLLPA
jgi:cation diffusion facilitator CzcD-associated flavoprotein CzcO